MLQSRKNKKDKRWRCLKRLDSMSDADVLQLHRKLNLQARFMSVGGFLLFILCIVAVVIVIPMLR